VSRPRAIVPPGEDVIDIEHRRSREVFFEIHAGLPREAPGDEASTEKALDRLPPLPGGARILDLGCGPGPATTLLARRTGRHVVALDLHRPFLLEARERARRADADSRVGVVHARMERPPFAPSTFDLVWSEGALYSVGFTRGLGTARRLLKPGGHLAATEAVWLTANPDEAIRRWWETEYPDIATVDATLHRIREAGFVVVAHFTLPERAWWAYYRPLEARLAELRSKHAGDRLALGVLGEAETEVDMYRRYGRSYGYEMFVCQRPA
jgi:SAM-dependent methyltransferase